MSDALSHLAAVTLGDMPSIRPRPAAFFAPQVRPPAAPLPDVVAALRAAPAPPLPPRPILPTAPPLVGDPTLIVRPAPSLRQLVRATATAGDLITPLSFWSPPLAEEMEHDPSSADAKSPGSAGTPQPAEPTPSDRQRTIPTPAAGPDAG